MTQHLCVPPDTFERIVGALPHLVEEASDTHRFVVIDGVEFSTPLQLGGAA